MINKNGLFIVLEGLDKSGKTTLAKQLLKQISPPPVYQKGLGSPTWIGKIARKKPSTFLFLLEMLYLNLKNYFYLRKGLSVVQDRFFVSLFSYLPTSQRWYNKIMLKMTRWMFLGPNLLIYCTVNKDERLKRLRSDIDNKYHAWLINHDQYIKKRDKIYQGYFNQANVPKIKIDTTALSIDQSVNKIISIIATNY